MTTHDHLPPEPTEFEASAKNLHDIIDDSFERPFETLGYTVDFTFQPPDNAGIYRPGPVHDFLRSGTDLPLASDRPWSTRLGHNPQTEEFDVLSVDIPLDSGNPEDTLVLKRIPSGLYLMLRRTADDAEPEPFASEVAKLEKMVSDKNSDLYAMNATGVKNILYAAGYTHPELSTARNDLRLHTTETLSEAREWHQHETIIVPVRVDHQVILIRDSYATPRSSEITDYDGTLRAIIEDVEGDTRQQLIIDFEGKDYWVGAPTITSQKITRARDPKIIAEYGPDAYMIASKEELEATVETIDMIAEKLLEELAD